MAAILVGAKVSVVYSKITLTFTQVSPKVLFGTLLKQKL